MIKAPRARTINVNRSISTQNIILPQILKKCQERKILPYGNIIITQGNPDSLYSAMDINAHIDYVIRTRNKLLGYGSRIIDIKGGNRKKGNPYHSITIREGSEYNFYRNVSPCMFSNYTSHITYTTDPCLEILSAIIIPTYTLRKFCMKLDETNLNTLIRMPNSSGPGYIICYMSDFERILNKSIDELKIETYLNDKCKNFNTGLPIEWERRGI